MEPSNLNDEELKYELEIRGIKSISDRRAATKALRSDLDKEYKGLKSSPYKTLPPISSKPFLKLLETEIGGLIREVVEATRRKDEDALNVLKSKLIHYSRKLDRVDGSESDEVRLIEKLQHNVGVELGTKTIQPNSPAGEHHENILKSIGDTSAAVENEAENSRNEAATLVDVPDTEEPTLKETRNATPLVNAPLPSKNGAISKKPARKNAIDALNSATDEGAESLEWMAENNARSNSKTTNKAATTTRVQWETNVGQSQSIPQNHLQGVSDFDRIIADQDCRISGLSAPHQEPRSSNFLLDTNTKGIYDFPPPDQPPSSYATGHNSNRDATKTNSLYGAYSLGIGSKPANNPSSNLSMSQLNTSMYGSSSIAANPNQNQQRFGQRTPLGNGIRQNVVSRRRNPVAEWNISFSGDSKEISLNDFLSQVALLARAERVTDEDLLVSAVYLFKGSASTWYRAFNPYFATWGQLIAGLRAQFLPVDYDFWLLRELEQRRQGETENFGIFFAAMEMLFRNLSVQLGEQQKLAIVMRNMLPFYAERLALEDICNLPQLAVRCKKIEEVKYRIGRQVTPQIHRKDLLEPAFSYQGQYIPRQRVSEIQNINEEEEPDYFSVAHISNPVQRTRLCYNCGEPGHQFNQCVFESRLFCYKCGAPDCVTRNCKLCQVKERGNASANSTMGSRLGSQSGRNQAPPY